MENTFATGANIRSPLGGAYSAPPDLLEKPSLLRGRGGWKEKGRKGGNEGRETGRGNGRGRKGNGKEKKKVRIVPQFQDFGCAYAYQCIYVSQLVFRSQ